jgi:hypothetical protein
VSTFHIDDLRAEARPKRVFLCNARDHPIGRVATHGNRFWKRVEKRTGKARVERTLTA